MAKIKTHAGLMDILAEVGAEYIGSELTGKCHVKFRFRYCGRTWYLLTSRVGQSSCWRNGANTERDLTNLLKEIDGRAPAGAVVAKHLQEPMQTPHERESYIWSPEATKFHRQSVEPLGKALVGDKIEWTASELAFVQRQLGLRDFITVVDATRLYREACLKDKTANQYNGNRLPLAQWRDAQRRAGPFNPLPLPAVVPLHPAAPKSSESAPPIEASPPAASKGTGRPPAPAWSGEEDASLCKSIAAARSIDEGAMVASLTLSRRSLGACKERYWHLTNRPTPWCASDFETLQDEATRPGPESRKARMDTVARKLCRPIDEVRRQWALTIGPHGPVAKKASPDRSVKPSADPFEAIPSAADTRATLNGPDQPTFLRDLAKAFVAELERLKKEKIDATQVELPVPNLHCAKWAAEALRKKGYEVMFLPAADSIRITWAL